MDTVSKKKRSEIMSRIRSKNTRPEMLVRKYLSSKGYKYSLHDKRLPGKPNSSPPIPENNPPTEYIFTILNQGLLKMELSCPVATLRAMETLDCRQDFSCSARFQPKRSLLRCRYINRLEEKQE